MGGKYGRGERWRSDIREAPVKESKYSQNIFTPNVVNELLLIDAKVHC